MLCISCSDETIIANIPFFTEFFESLYLFVHKRFWLFTGFFSRIFTAGPREMIAQTPARPRDARGC